MRKVLANFFTPEGIEKALSFSPSPDDVFIATYPKCGTTWTQQIFHGLRTRGAMDFEEISCAVPWLEATHDMGMDPYHPQVALPRGFKTHFTWNLVPKGARYIYVIRNPEDVLLSYYRFLSGWFFIPGSIDMETFTFDYYLEGTRNENYWAHLRSWWQQRDADNVLIIAFENMKADLASHVASIARFARIEADADCLRIATRQAEIDFMQRHQHRFDDHVLRDLRDPVLVLPPGSDSSKVREGKVGKSAKSLPDSVKKALQDRWNQEIRDPLDFATYDELRTALLPAP